MLTGQHCLEIISAVAAEVPIEDDPVVDSDGEDENSAG